MSIGSRELQLFADNDSALSRLRMQWAKNLAAKKARGTYQRDLAHKAFMNFARDAAKVYVKKFDSRGGKWNAMFTIVDRNDFAGHYVDWFTAEHKLGNFESLLPAKWQKAATRKGTVAAMKLVGGNGATVARKGRS